MTPFPPIVTAASRRPEKHLPIINNLTQGVETNTLTSNDRHVRVWLGWVLLPLLHHFCPFWHECLIAQRCREVFENLLLALLLGYRQE